MTKRYRRKRLWIDPPFQTRLLLHAACSLALYALLIWHIGLFFEVLKTIHTSGFIKNFWTAYRDYLEQQGPLLIAFVFFTPALLLDLLKFSNRLAGPLQRCRQ